MTRWAVPIFDTLRSQIFLSVAYNPDTRWTVPLVKFQIKEFSKFFLQVDAVFKRNDGNHDGKLTLEEFQEFMHNHEKKKSPDS